MPRISEQLRKELLIESLRKRVRHLYIYGESHPKEKPEMVAKLDGFLEAASLLRVCGTDDLQEVIDEEHLAIFGLSRLERAERRAAEDEVDKADWSVYEAPALDRLPARGKRARRYSYSPKSKKKHISPQENRRRANA